MFVGEIRTFVPITRSRTELLQYRFTFCQNGRLSDSLIRTSRLDGILYRDNSALVPILNGENLKQISCSRSPTCGNVRHLRTSFHVANRSIFHEKQSQSLRCSGGRVYGFSRTFRPFRK